jgi:hypothetical protein
LTANPQNSLLPVVKSGSTTDFRISLLQ